MDTSSSTQISILREKLVALDNDVYDKQKSWCDDAQIGRFLIARRFDLNATYEMIITALKWRVARIPSDEIQQSPAWFELFESLLVAI